MSSRSTDTLSPPDLRPVASVRRLPLLTISMSCTTPTVPGAWVVVDTERTDEIVIGRCGAERSIVRDGRTLRVQLPDIWASRRHARIFRASLALRGGWAIEDLGSHNGTRVHGEAVQTEWLRRDSWIQIGNTHLRWQAEVKCKGDTPEVHDLAVHDDGPRTLSPRRWHLLDGVRRNAAMLSRVLVLGETGTGKEVMARWIHEHSQRTGAFVPVNCGALSPQLIEAELFGSVRGAFTGATKDRPGYVRAADGGTLFLDEIGDLPLAAQGVLLRVLQESAVTPVGGTSPISVRLSVIAATHRDLRAMVAAGDFREDLYHRLTQQQTIELPALRDRPEDIGTIAADVLARMGAPAREIWMESEVGRDILGRSYAGNVRELERLLWFGVRNSSGGCILPQHLVEDMFSSAVSVCGGRNTDVGRCGTKSRTSRGPGGLAGQPVLSAGASGDTGDLRIAVVTALQACNGRVAPAATQLGLSRQALYRLLESLGVDVHVVRGRRNTRTG